MMMPPLLDIALPISYDWFLLGSRVLLASLIMLFLWRVVVIVSRESLRTAAPAGTWSLILLDELDRPLRGFRISRRRPVTVGRDAANDVVLTDRSVSGSHAILRFVGNQWIVADLESRNGTFLNGEQVIPESGIIPGDVVQFGAVRLQLVTDETRF
jgi:hypothetical protein